MTWHEGTDSNLNTNVVVISEKYRSCGIGTALFEKALSICKDKKIEEIDVILANKEKEVMSV